MRRSALAWVVFALTMTCLLIAVLLPDEDWPRNAIVFLGLALTFASVCGTLIGSRRPGNPVGWILLAIAFSIAAGLTATQWANRALIDAPGSLPGGVVAAWLQSWLWTPLTGLFPLLILLFPTGRLPSRRWAVLGWAAAAGTVVPGLLIALRSGPFDTFKHVDNPLGIEALSFDFATALGGIWIATIPAAVLSLFLRFRRAIGTERLQIKWVFFATVAAVGLVLLNPLVFLLNANRDPVIFGLHMGLIFPVLAFALLPAAIAVAILRYRLFEIDRLISRTLSYAAVTAVLATTFAVLVLAPTLVVGVGAETPDWLVAVATVAVAALFRPVRHRVQDAVDHRFNRRRYDARKTVEAFAGRLREEVDVEKVLTELETSVRQAMQPVHMSVWLPRGTRLRR